MTTTTKTRPAPEGLGSKLAYLTGVLKTPTIGRTWETLAEAARQANWSHEEYLAAVLERQVADRESAGTTMRIRTAHFPAIKSSTSSTCRPSGRTCSLTWPQRRSCQRRRT